MISTVQYEISKEHVELIHLIISKKVRIYIKS
jgi:hypothetical protein